MRVLSSFTAADLANAANEAGKVAVFLFFYFFDANIKQGEAIVQFLHTQEDRAQSRLSLPKQIVVVTLTFKTIRIKR